jgi:ATP-binding cassette subfamily B protein
VASVQESDLIVVLEDGEILATGTHDELLESCEEYRSIYESQTRNRAAESDDPAEEADQESAIAQPGIQVPTLQVPTINQFATVESTTGQPAAKEGGAR